MDNQIDKDKKEDMCKQLQTLINKGMINKDMVQNMFNILKAEEKKEILARHPYDIAMQKDGYYHTYVPDSSKSNNRRHIKRKSLESIQEAVYQAYKDNETSPTVRWVYEQAIKRSLELGELKKQSSDRYDSDFERFFANSLYPLADRKIKTVTEQDIIKLMDSCISGYSLTAKTFSGLKILLRLIFRYAKPEFTDISITNCLGDYQTPLKALSNNKRKKKPEEECFTNQEYALLYTYLINNKDIKNLGLLISLETGIRVGELSALKSSDFFETKDSKGNALYILRVSRTECKIKDDSGKSKVVVNDIPKTEKSESDIVISQDVYGFMLDAKDLNPNGEFLFMNTVNGNRIRGSYFNKRLKKVCKKLHLAEKSTHKLRRYYATALHFSKVPDAFIKDQMRHQDIATTNKSYIYDNCELDEKNELVQIADSYKKNLISKYV